VSLRSAFYKTARLMGDINAAQKGRIPQRLERRFLGRIAGRLIGAIMRRRK
jgi:hypothetical protein